MGARAGARTHLRPADARRPRARPAPRHARSVPLVGWTEALCTSLLPGVLPVAAPRRAPCVVAAVTHLSACWPPPPPAAVAEAERALLRIARAEGLLEGLGAAAAAEGDALEFGDAVCALTGLPAAAARGGLGGLAAAALRRPALSFWSSAALLFLTARNGRVARALARWLHGVRLPPPHADAAFELPYALRALLAADAWRCAGARALAADLRCVAAPLQDTCLPSEDAAVAAGQHALWRPTPEQAAVVHAALQPGQTARVVAFAGSGKTATLRAFAAARPRWRMLYCAFNKEAAKEAAQRFDAPGLHHVTCLTTHALAARGVGLLQTRLGARGKPFLGARELNNAVAAPFFPGEHASRVNWACSAVKAFLVSDDADVTAAHLTAEAANAAATATLALARRMAARMLNPADAFPFTYNAFLRAFVLSEPTLPFDCLLVDEAHYLNPITLRLLNAQRHAAKVFVGDSHQQIYSFNGTRNALPGLAAQHSFSLTRSFRFGAGIAAVADKVLALKGEAATLRGARLYAESTVRARDEPEMPAPGSRLAGIVRQNATWIELAAAAGRAGRRVHLKADNADSLLAMAHDIYLVSCGRSDEVTERNRRLLGRFTGLSPLEEWVTSIGDLALRSLVAFVRRHGGGVPALLAAVHASRVGDEAAADVVLGTTHKTKGLEYADVHVASDLVTAVLAAEMDEATGLLPAEVHEELNLVYVALTRARRRATLPCALLHALDSYGALSPAPEWDAEEAADADVPPGARCGRCGAAVASGRPLLALPLFSSGGTQRLCADCAHAAPGALHGAHLATLVRHLCELQAPPAAAQE
jgi:hypothetical protein